MLHLAWLFLCEDMIGHGMTEETFDEIFWKTASLRDRCKGCGAIEGDMVCKLVVVDGTEGYFVGTLLNFSVRYRKGRGPLVSIETSLSSKCRMM